MRLPASWLPGCGLPWRCFSAALCPGCGERGDLAKHAVRLYEFPILAIPLLVPLLFDPFSTGPVEGVKAGTAKVLPALALLAWVLARVQTGKRQDAPSPSAGEGNTSRAAMPGLVVLLPVLVYGGVYLLATLFSQEPRTSWFDGDTYHGFLSLLCVAVLYALSVEVFKDPRKIDLTINLILLGSVPVAIYGCLQFLGLDPLTWQTTSTSRVHSTIGYSLALGAYLAMVAPFTLLRLFDVEIRVKPRKMAAYGLLLVVQVACLVFTLSRGAMLSLLVSILVLLAALAAKSGWFRGQPAWLGGGLAVALMLCVLVFITVSPGWGTSLAEITGISQQQLLENRQISNTGRLALWELTLPLIAERPLLGYGPETYALAFIEHYPDEVETNPLSLQYWDAHNLFLSQAMSAGLLGLAAYLGVVVFFYWRVLARLRKTQDACGIQLLAALVASATAYLVQAQFNPAGVVPTILFWMVMAMGVGMTNDIGDMP